MVPAQKLDKHAYGIASLRVTEEVYRIVAIPLPVWRETSEENSFFY
jgi:hypothetical protein